MACDDEGKHLVFYLRSRWDRRTHELFPNVDGVKQLITQKDNKWHSPLHLVLKDVNAETAHAFIEQGDADILDSDPDGNTALHHLCQTLSTGGDQGKLSRPPIPRSQELCDMFLDAGGSINTPNNQAITPFMKCVNLLNLDYFIQHDGDFHAEDHEGQTVLHKVAQSWSHFVYPQWTGDLDENATWFKRLMGLGCDPLVEDVKGRASLEMAAATGHKNILKLFERKKEL